MDYHYRPHRLDRRERYCRRPTNPDIIYIATGDRDLWDSKSVGVLKSIDAGATWTHPLATPMRDLEMHPTNGMILYAGSANGQFFRSSDAGKTWI